MPFIPDFLAPKYENLLAPKTAANDEQSTQPVEPEPRICPYCGNEDCTLYSSDRKDVHTKADVSECDSCGEIYRTNEGRTLTFTEPAEHDDFVGTVNTCGKCMNPPRDLTPSMVEKFVQESFPPNWRINPGKRIDGTPPEMIGPETSPGANHHQKLHSYHTLTSAYYRELANRYQALGDKKSADEHNSLSYQHGELARVHKVLFDILNAKGNQ
jgi:hypothetical protein